MSFEVDMTGYLEAIKQMIPDFAGGDKPIPKLGKAVSKVEFIDGYAHSSASIPKADIQACIHYLRNLKSSEKPSKPVKETAKKLKSEKKPPEPKAEKLQKDVTYWQNQGDLTATYGNDKAAIRYYKKALQLDPDNSRIYYKLGVSYGETGQYKQAIASIDKALSKDSQTGLYFYGRGRVYLLSGDKESAVEDFKRAAVLGDRDAQDYLRNVLHMEWQ